MPAVKNFQCFVKRTKKHNLLVLLLKLHHGFAGSTIKFKNPCDTNVALTKINNGYSSSLIFLFHDDK